jgi:hypothetical protein
MIISTNRKQKRSTPITNLLQNGRRMVG